MSETGRSARALQDATEAAEVVRPFPGVSADEFKGAFRHHPGGVALITADNGERPVALTATSVSSVSAEPPLLLFSVSAISSSAPVLCASDTFVVHLLDAESLHLAKLGATSGIDRFADQAQWTRLSTGEPVFHDAPVWLRCRVLNRLAIPGASTIIVGEAVQVGHRAATGEPPVRDGLAYVNRTWHRLHDGNRID